MKFVTILFFILILSLSKCKIAKENLIGLSIIKGLNIKNCLVVEDLTSSENKLQNVKLFAKNNVFSVFMEESVFFNLLVWRKLPISQSGIIIKSYRLADAFNIFLDTVSNEKEI